MKKIIKSFGFAIMLFLSGTSNILAAVSNPPTTLPAAPVHDSNSVLSFFSGVYTNAASISGFSGTGTTTVETVLGDQMIYIENGLNGWANINLTTPLNIDNYDSLYIDVYVVSGAFDLKVMFTDGSTTFIIPPKLQEGWNKVGIRLNAYRDLATPPDFTSVSKIGLINNGGYARTVYVDNIYACGIKTDNTDPELPSQAAPIPAHDAEDVKSIFSDAYTNITEIQSFSGVGTGKFLTAFPGDEMIKISGGLNNWSNLHFTSVNIDNMEYIHIDIFVVRETGTVELKFRFDDGIGNEVVRTLNPGWNNLDIALADLKGTSRLNNVSLFRMLRTNGYPQNVFIDNIYTHGILEDTDPGDPSDPNAPTIAAPVPQHAAEDVKSIFSNAYTNITSLVLNNAGNPPLEMTQITPFEGDDMMRFTSLNWGLIKFDPFIDLNDMDYIHFDVWAEGTPSIKAGLGGWASQPTTDALALKPGWTSFDIPLNVFRNLSVDLTNVIVLRLISSNGFAIGRLYFDNIYAYKGDPITDKPVPTYEIESAPEPIMAPSTVKSIFTEKYTNITEVEEGNSGATTQFKLVYLTETDKVLRMRSLDEMAVKTAASWNIDDMEFIHFNVYYDNNGADGSLEIGLQSFGSETEVYSAVVPELKNGEWTYVNIPLQAFKSAGMDCSAIENILFRGSGNIYLDNIFAFKGDYTLGLGEEGKISVDWVEASKNDELPDRDFAFLGVNLATGSGGTVPGIYNTSYSYPTFQDLYYFKSKGVRLIRLPFRWERVQHEVNGPLDLELDVAKIKEVVAEAERIGMYVMLDMHDYCRRKVNGVTYKFGESPNLTNEHFADVWTKLAGEFKDFTNIWGYDIMNEPYSLSQGVWFSAAQAAINGIRTVDTETSIVIEGQNYAASYSWLTTGADLINLQDPSDNLIFQAHCYFDNNKSGHYELGSYDLEVSNPNEPINRLKPFVDWLKDNNQKGILGEFGVPRTDVRWLDLLNNVVEYLKENQLSATYWVGGSWYAGDKVSVQPLENYTVERAQMRVLEKYIADFHIRENSGINDKTVNNNNTNLVAAYPNPLSDIVYIESEVEMRTIEIFNIAGQEVKALQGKANRFEVNLQDMLKGTYILRVRFEDGSMASKKLVKM